MSQTADKRGIKQDKTDTESDNPVEDPAFSTSSTARDVRHSRVDRILKGIPDLNSLGEVQLLQLISTEAGQVKLGFKVSREEFETWKVDKEEIGAYEYNYSREEIIIEADRGAVHENTIGIMFCWFRVDVSLREGTLVLYIHTKVALDY